MTGRPWLYLWILLVFITGKNAWAATPQIAAGGYHTVALRSDGTLWGWGWNGFGQLGDGSTDDSLSPIKIGNDTDWTSIAAGSYHTVALKKDGTLWTWGWNRNGQLGDGTTTDSHSPKKIGSDTDWASIATGMEHTVALKKDGTLWTWGLNTYGQLGDGSTDNKYAPVKIGSDTDWIAITAGAGHTVALKEVPAMSPLPARTLWAWGVISTGNSKSSPVQIGTDMDWSAISAGASHTMELKRDGTLWAWGSNAYGQLGDGTTDTRLFPVQIDNNSDWSAVASAPTAFHTTAIKKDGTFWTWGRNDYGQIGDGTTNNRITPFKIDIENVMPIELPRTGQTEAYITGDDGDIQAGVAWPDKRFTVKGKVVVDNLTGLMWVKRPDSTMRTWAEALTYANGLNLGDHDDWRLPNINELESLTYAGKQSTAKWLNSQGFRNVKNNTYWTSTTCAGDTNLAWRIGFESDDYTGLYSKTIATYVLPVRDGKSDGKISLPKTGQTVSYASGDDGDLLKGAPLPGERFTVDGDCITDNLTTLTWSKIPETGDWANWAASLNYANNKNLCGHNDWRLPNRKELRSIVHYGQKDLAAWLNGKGFSGVQNTKLYWTSTTIGSNPDTVWTLHMLYGKALDQFKSDAASLLIVRGGNVEVPSLKAPANLKAEAISSSSIALTWKDKSNNEKGFKIERKRGRCNSVYPWEEIATVKANVKKYTDNDLSPNKVYSYRVKAYNDNGESEYTGCVTAKTKGLNHEAPGAAKPQQKQIR